MENIFTIAAYCLHDSDIAKKIEATHHARALSVNGKLSYKAIDPIKTINKTKFPEHPLLLPPRDMPKRKLNTPAGKIAFFHALAHIEFIAIYLAWDILYRFRNLPEQFYQDWLKIADEEAQHFQLIRAHLLTMGSDYGDLPAHRGLWNHAEDTADDVLARLAIVPRCMEARGLDVTPQMIKKFEQQQDAKSVELLTRILNDEIGHVEIGSYWFKLLCKEKDLAPEEHFKKMITQCYIGKPKGPFNRELRIIAGFSNAEIDWLDEKL